MQALKRYAPELLLVLLGCALRLSLLRSNSVTGGYDFYSHFVYYNWFVDHWSLPQPYLSREAFQPPLYYLLAGTILRAGAATSALPILAIAFGTLRLGMIWIGLEQFLPGNRPARLAALALAAVLPASVHMDAMASNEAPNAALAALAIYFIARVFDTGGEAAGRERAWLAAAAGAVLGLELLTKISALTILAAAGAAGAVEFFWSRGRARVMRALTWALALALTLSVAGWYFARNHRLYGVTFPVSFDFKERYLMKDIEKIPYWKRRDPGFFLGWSAEIYDAPYYPSALSPPRFFPVLLASTFVDYYNFRYCRPPAPDEPMSAVLGKPLRSAAQPLGALSALGGTLIAAATVGAFCAALIAAWRRRRAGELFLLLTPFFALLGALHFAVAYPFDSLGHIKGVFLQYAAPPLCGLFGLAVAWAWHRRRALAWVQLGALGLVALYSIYCRI